MLRQSETREALNEEVGKDTPDEARLTELRGKAQAIEVELRTALEDDETPATETTTTTDPETRERLEIRGRTGIADFIRAAAGGRSVDGAAREYAAACGVSEMQSLPLAIFRDGRPSLETRALTPGPAVDGAVEPVVPYVFEATAAASLGIAMPTTGAGAVQTPRVTTAPPAGTLAKDAAAPSTAAAIALDSQSPKRIAGQFEVRVEDLAIYPELENVLGEAIRGSLGSELDEQVFNGTNAGGDLKGLFKQATDVAIAGATETYATGIARFASLVDGTHSYGLGDIRAVVGSRTFAAYMGLFHGGSGDTTLADYLRRELGSFRVSDRVPAFAANGQKGIVALTAGPSPVRLYIWSALEIIRDPYSGAGSGKVTLTATALVSDVYIPHGNAQVKEIHPKLS